MIKETKFLKYNSRDGEITIPFAKIKGDKKGPRVVISAGVHGCEYVSMRAVIDLFNEIQPQDICGEIDFVPIVNMPAFTQRVPFVCPVDGKNPNRVCPGSPDGSYSEALVWHLLNDIVKGADCYLDLHCGDLIEAIEAFSLYHLGVDSAIEKKSEEIAKAYGIENLIVTRSDTSWPDYYTTYANGSILGVPSVTCECGGFGQVTPADLNKHLTGLHRVLAYMGVMECPEKYKEKTETHYRVFDDFLWVYSPVAGLYIPEAGIGKEVKKGERLGCITDCFGKEIYELTAPQDGRILFVETTLSIQDNGLVLAIGKYIDK